jgi:hypothetical protein
MLNRRRSMHAMRRSTACSCIISPLVTGPRSFCFTATLKLRGCGGQSFRCSRRSQTWADARRLDLFRVMAAAGERFCAALANEINHAGAVDWQRQIARQRAGCSNEARRGRCHSHGAKGYRPLGARGKAERNNRRANEISVKLSMRPQRRARPVTGSLDA